LLYVWAWVFVGRMMLKENSLRKKEGWETYDNHSYVFFPKVGTNFFTTWFFYVLFFGVFYMLWIGGGV